MAFDTIGLSAMTHPGSGLHDRVRAAAAHGYQGIGLRPRDLRRAREAGHSDADLRLFIEDHGIEVIEVEVVFGWGGPDDEAASARRYEAQVFDLADTLGGRYLVAVSDLAGPWERSVELLAGLCDRAADHGLGIAVEFLPWTDVPSPAAALDLIEATGRANAGMIVDTWHFFRGVNDWDALRAIPESRVATIQFDDAAEPTEQPLMEQTFERLLPGEGVFDLVTFLQVMGEVAPEAPLCIEVISSSLAAMDVDAAVGAAMESTRSASSSAAFPAG